MFWCFFLCGSVALVLIFDAEASRSPCFSSSSNRWANRADQKKSINNSIPCDERWLCLPLKRSSFYSPMFFFQLLILIIISSPAMGVLLLEVAFGNPPCTSAIVLLMLRSLTDAKTLGKRETWVDNRDNYEAENVKNPKSETLRSSFFQVKRPSWMCFTPPGSYF